MSRPLTLRNGGVVALILIAIAFPFLAPSNYLIGVGVLVLIYACAAIAWNILTGFAGQFSFGHAAWFGLGAYTSGLLLLIAHVNPWLGMVVGMLLAAAVATVLGLITFRLKGIYFGLMTFAFALILETLARHFSWTGGDVGFSPPVLSEDSLAMFQFATQLPYYWIGLGFLTVYMAIELAIHHGRFGYYLRAIRDDEGAAAAMGINPRQVKLMAYAISAAMTAALGTFYVQLTLFMDPVTAFGLDRSVAILLGAVVGGVGSLWGPLVGALVLQVINTTVNAFFKGALQGSVVNDAYAVAIVVIVLLLPGGLVTLPRKLFKVRRGRRSAGG